ncbi:sulfur carrier protein ThiS [Candidatus Micrarchaeota archaeon]|nr:sulfur carrier protein ThiS [Candidatus Micrarchaeota archaeon]
MDLIIDGKPTSLEFNGTVLNLLRKLKISSEIVVVKRNGQIIPENETVADNDKVEIMRVIFGG